VTFDGVDTEFHPAVVLRTTSVLVTLTAASPVATIVPLGEPDTCLDRRWTVPVARLTMCGFAAFGNRVTRSPDLWNARGPAMSRSRSGEPRDVAPYPSDSARVTVTGVAEWIVRSVSVTVSGSPAVVAPAAESHAVLVLTIAPVTAFVTTE